MVLRTNCWMVAFALVSAPAIAAEGPDKRHRAAPTAGEAIYADHCARCHGASLEGQPNWRMRAADGKLPAPPHDETGHTWHHPDRVLFEIVKSGLVPPHAPADYQSDMPAFGDLLSDHQIQAVLSYIKSRWPADVQAHQADINARASSQPVRP